MKHLLIFQKNDIKYSERIKKKRGKYQSLLRYYLFLLQEGKQ